MPDYIVEARHVSKSYARKQALKDISLQVRPGTIYGLLGPNGAGKTTFIRILTQIIGPDTGELFFSGQRLKREHIERIGYMPEERGLYRKMKVGEQIMYFARLKGLSRSDASKAIAYWFRVFDIEDWWNKKVEELSKGMQQKIQFITTVIHKPELIILDEPFSGFDPVNSDIIRQELLRLKEEGATIILSTHRMESVEELCDELSLIHNAEKVLEGEVYEVQQRYKQHIYELVLADLAGELPILEHAGFEVDTMEHNRNGHLHLRFRTSGEVSTNEILRQLLTVGTIISFKEVLPSIHDIFIQLVKGVSHE